MELNLSSITNASLMHHACATLTALACYVTTLSGEMQKLPAFTRKKILMHCVDTFRARFDAFAYALCREAGASSAHRAQPKHSLTTAHRAVP